MAGVIPGQRRCLGPVRGAGCSLAHGGRSCLALPLEVIYILVLTSGCQCNDGRTCCVPEVDDEAEDDDGERDEVQPVDSVMLYQTTVSISLS